VIPTKESAGSEDRILRLLWAKSGGLVPLNTGGKIRSFNLLKELARNHDVTLFTFYGRHPGDSHQQLQQYFSRVVCVPIELPEARGAGEAMDYARNLFSLRPYTMAKYCRPEVARALLDLLRECAFDAIVCDFLFSADVIPWDWPCPKVLFTHNVEEQIWRRHFQVSRNPVWKAVSWREYQTMRAAERRYVRLADHVLVVSENDRSYFASYADASKITVIPTGVDIEYFQPGTRPEKPDTLVFTGSMDWLPNEDAIFYFKESILSQLQREVPNVELRVVGRKPSQRLQMLAEENSCIQVTGEVPDIRPHVHESSVYVVPLRIGGGTRIKIFEAMAMGKAVVSTPVGAEGLPVRHGENIVLAEEPKDFARQVARLLRDPAERERIGRAARTLVERNYSCRSVAGVFDVVLHRVTAESAEPFTEVLHSQKS
jgi:sugar transferase (PEP-CTERM/EpsH1 system associated)